MTFQEKYNAGELKGDTGEKGDAGERGQDGADYVLTDEDKNSIAELAVSKIGYGDGRRY